MKCKKPLHLYTNQFHMITIQDLDLMNKKTKDMKEMVRTRQQRQTRQKGKKQEQHDWLFNSTFQAACVTQLAMFGYCHCGSLFYKFLFSTTFLWVAFLDILQNAVVAVGHCTANLLLWINFCKIASSIYYVQIIVLQLLQKYYQYNNKLQIIPLVNFWRHTDGQGQCGHLISGQ